MPQDTVLVIEGEAEVVQLVRASLELEGLRVVATGDAQQALSLARQEPPALILLDLLIPGLGGWRVLDELERDPHTADVPVVVLTGRADDPYILHGLERGAIAYLARPVDPVRLVDLVRSLLQGIDQRGREQRRRQLMAERRRLRRSLDELF